MNKEGIIQIFAVMITGTALLFVSGCADNYSGYQSDGGRAYYDQYIERPGYYDFSRPVIFVPEDSSVGNEPR